MRLAMKHTVWNRKPLKYGIEMCHLHHLTCNSTSTAILGVSMNGPLDRYDMDSNTTYRLRNRTFAKLHETARS